MARIRRYGSGRYLFATRRRYVPHKWRNHQSFARKVSRPSDFSKRRLQLAAEIMRFNTSRLFLWGYVQDKIYADAPQSIHTQKKYLIESKKLFAWNTFFDVKKCFVLMKQNLFDSNKISLDQINFCLKWNKLYLWLYINALISLFWTKINLIQTNIYLVQRYFVWIKTILFHLNKSFLQIKESGSNKSFSFIQ